MDTFVGSSKEGVLQDALKAAVKHAYEALSAGGADIQISWRLESVSGVRGGIMGLNELDVTILATKP